MFIAVSYDDHGCMSRGTKYLENDILMAETFEDITAQLEQSYNNFCDDDACPDYVIYELGQSWSVNAERTLTMTIDKNNSLGDA